MHYGTYPSSAHVDDKKKRPCAAMHDGAASTLMADKRRSPGDPAIGQRIRKAREALRMTQDQLNSLVGGSSQGLVSKWESGTKALSQDTIRELAKALHVSADYLLFGEEGPDMPPVEFQQWLNGLTVDERAEMTVDETRFLANLRWEGLGRPSAEWYDEALEMYRKLRRKQRRTRNGGTPGHAN